MWENARFPFLEMVTFETNLQMLLAQKGCRPEEPDPYITCEKMLSHGYMWLL